MNSNTFKTAPLAALFTFTFAAHSANVAGSHSKGHDAKKDDHADANGHGHAMAIGGPGKPAEVDRTIVITMSDNFFEPEEIKIKKGETIRFVVANKGEFLHEFNIGTSAMHAAHQKEMDDIGTYTKGDVKWAN